MNINYDYYRVFYYVAKYGSFTKAANVLNSDQPDVTRCINRLERQIGCSLFIRNNRGAVLTPEGSALYIHVAAACDQIQEGEDELEGARSMQSGTVTIGASETALHIFLLDKLQQFHELYPNIHLRISNHSTPQAVSALERGLVDLVVVTTPINAEKPLRETLLDSFQEILIGGKNFSFLADERLHFSDLKKYPFICLGQDTMTYLFYSRLFLNQGLILQPDTEAATADQILPLVKYNLGLGFIPEKLAADALVKGEVVKISFADTIPLRHICLIQDDKRTLSIAARSFEETLCEKKNTGSIVPL
jgi:DNA-binding transcriptional LysR family regulator